ncbi:endonuclease/exonuclease/phosphatase family protein [Pseudactinotalea sp.]|uniref:endonuclease/exonuclease/phosphatase family protein n=1 Tax=Pseudactinotalea sp. TaxID=1926260 RepID=UPI003B3B367C
MSTVVGHREPPEIHVMTFNVRCDAGSPTGHPDHWPDRAPLLTRMLAVEQPDLLGVQEPFGHQLGAIRAGLGDRYRMVGASREVDPDGEHSSIFYDADRFEALESGQYWLSETPQEVGSTGWGATLPRIVVWARLRDRATGRVVLHANSHFDHASEAARVRSAEVVADQLSGAIERVDAVLFTADANAAAERSEPYRVATEDTGLRDAWLAADQRLTPAIGTFPDYRAPVADGDRIDWILVGGNARVHAAAIDAGANGGAQPSDHAAVHAVVTIG